MTGTMQTLLLTGKKKDVKVCIMFICTGRIASLGTNEYSFTNVFHFSLTKSFLHLSSPTPLTRLMVKTTNVVLPLSRKILHMLFVLHKLHKKRVNFFHSVRLKSPTFIKISFAKDTRSGCATQVPSKPSATSLSLS